MKRLLLLPIPALLLLAGCTIRDGRERWVEVSRDTTHLTCYGERLEGPFGSRFARGPVVASPTGEWQAYAEVEAIALRGGDSTSCQNQSRLLVSRGGGEFREVFIQRPGGEGKNGNGLTIIDWAPDGRRLLVELNTWTYPTEEGDPVLFYYDTATDTVLPIDTRTVSSADAACPVIVRAAGFTSEGEVVLTSRTVRSEKCRDEGRQWRLAGDGSGAAPLPVDFRTERYGRNVNGVNGG